MVFCAYCGKSFTRKEHLERHIPSHTNVKPHRCTSCQLAFARRDLLQRHYSTYHEIRDPTLPPPASIPTVAGRTPIACLNCASAKTGCDKRVPCSRCADKSLVCEARFARRSSKLMARAIAASEASEQVPESTEPKPPQHPVASAPPKDIDLAIEPRLPLTPAIENALPTPQIFGPDTFGGPGSARFDGLDDFVYSGGLVSPGFNYQDLLTWNNDFSMDIELYRSLTSLPTENMPPVFSDQGDISSSSDISSGSTQRGPSISHTRSCSLSSAGDLDISPSKRPKLSCCAVAPEFEEILAAELAWPLARCNPPTFSDSCPRTAVVHLESLEQNSRHEHAWDSLDLESDCALSASDTIKVNPISPGTRDTLHAITQGFLIRALKTHRGGLANKYQNGEYPNPGNPTFLLLPPTNVLEYFLRSYARSLSTYYCLAPKGRIDPNELIHGNQGSTLLILLMIAKGATKSASIEARCLSAGLTETCRISLFDIIERDIELCADPILLRCALLFTMLGAWSGDKWHMDIVMGQRGMYLAMLKHAGMLEPQDMIVPTLGGSSDVEVQWHAWLRAETRRRLVYNWVLLDQELSLFHDLSTVLSISELQAPLPHSNIALFSASSAQSWSTLIFSPSSTPHIPTSLHDLFQDFIHDNLSHPSTPMTPLTLRLLLHPIQSLLYQVRQVLSCFSDVLSTRRSSTRSLTKASTLTRLEEVQSLLQKWYNLHLSLPASVSGSADDSTKTTNLILYHLISLNAHTSFPALERLARRAPATLATANPYWDLSLQHQKCIHDSSSALFHSGQILRLLSPSLPTDYRPPWAPLAIYRAALVLWVDVLAKSDPSFPQQTAEGAIVVINESAPEDAALMDWLWKGEGIPVIRGKDGTVTRLEAPETILGVCIGFVGGAEKGREGTGGRLADGIERKLKMLRGNWHGAGGLA